MTFLGHSWLSSFYMMYNSFMDKKQLTNFLIKARSNTYAGDSGKVESVFKGSYQLEFTEGDWFYRDVYNNGNGIFVGLETIYFKDTPVWSMSYFGNYKKLSEEEVDKVLRKSLIEKQDDTRLFKEVSYENGDYKYECEGYGEIDELGGTEKIYKNGEEVYYLYYAGGIVSN